MVNSFVVWLAIKNYFVIGCLDSTMISVIYLNCNLLLFSVKLIYLIKKLFTSNDSDQ